MLVWTDAVACILGLILFIASPQTICSPSYTQNMRSIVLRPAVQRGPSRPRAHAHRHTYTHACGQQHKVGQPHQGAPSPRTNKPVQLLSSRHRPPSVASLVLPELSAVRSDSPAALQEKVLSLFLINEFPPCYEPLLSSTSLRRANREPQPRTEITQLAEGLESRAPMCGMDLRPRYRVNTNRARTRAQLSRTY